MTYKLVNGDYEKAEGSKDLEKCEYIDELLQSISMVLYARRGGFYPNKDFGSSIRTALSEPKAGYIAAYARQALEGIDGVFVKEAEPNPGSVRITLMINDTERRVSINL